MIRSQKHRGPNDEGIQAIETPGGALVLGHRRLSILDLSSAGHQPMQNSESGDWIVYNGEIYNAPELRRELQTAGAVFRGHCDTEVVHHAFAHWGTDCFDRLHGMFAVALYDKQRERLILARDPVGIKPLYYAVHLRGFVFGSELRAFKACGLLPCELDRRAVAGLLAYGAVPGPLTLYEDVRLLDPGTWGSLQLSRATTGNNQLETKRYWNFPNPRSITNRKEAVEEVRSRLENAARSHLLSDVPVGVFLSSGLDSTAVATLCAQANPEAVRTFTVSLADDPAIDENPVAQKTAQLIGAKHQCVTLNEHELRKQVRRWLEDLDQPSVDGLNTYIVAGAVREQGMKVALSGLGGDEVFGGYRGFRDIPRLARWARRGHWIPSSMRGKFAELACACKSKAQRRKAIELARTRPMLRHITLRRRRLFSDFEMRMFGLDTEKLELNEDFLPWECEPGRGLDGLDPESEVGVLETRFYMGNMLLRDSDVFGMAHGVEIRVPFLDRGIIDYVFSLPGKWRVEKDGVNKPFLVDALRKRLRPEVVHLRKRGFALPQAKWMAGPLREQFEHLLETTRQAGILEPCGVSTVWQDFLDDTQGPTWSRAWLLSVLGAWLDRIHNSPPASMAVD